MGFIVKGDHIFKETTFDNTYTRHEVVIDKQTFVEAYNRWIKGTEQQEVKNAYSKFIPKYTADEVTKILRSLQSDFEEMKMNHNTDKDTWNSAISVCSHLIDNRINTLEKIEKGGLEILDELKI